MNSVVCVECMAVLEPKRAAACMPDLRVAAAASVPLALVGEKLNAASLPSASLQPGEGVSGGGSLIGDALLDAAARGHSQGVGWLTALRLWCSPRLPWSGKGPC